MLKCHFRKENVVNHFIIKSLVVALLLSQSAAAQSTTVNEELKSVEARQAAAQLKRVISDKLQQIVALELAAGADINDIDYALQQGEQSSHERFGALFSNNNKGLILSVTPNSPASKLGLVSGDIIISVNDILLKNKTFTEVFKQHYTNSSTAVSIKLERDGRAQYLSGELSSLMTPAWTLSVKKIASALPVQPVAELQASSEQCGRIVVGKYMPLKEDDLVETRPVEIREINGVKQRLSTSGRGSVIGLSVATSTANKTRFKLPAGKHKITVSPRMAIQTKQSSSDISSIGFDDEYEFAIDIAPNKTYYLVYDTRKDSPFTNTNMPIIWQTKSQTCQLS